MIAYISCSSKQERVDQGIETEGSNLSGVSAKCVWDDLSRPPEDEEDSRSICIGSQPRRLSDKGMPSPKGVKTVSSLIKTKNAEQAWNLIILGEIPLGLQQGNIFEGTKPACHHEGHSGWWAHSMVVMAAGEIPALMLNQCLTTLSVVHDGIISCRSLSVRWQTQSRSGRLWEKDWSLTAKQHYHPSAARDRATRDLSKCSSQTPAETH